MEALRYIFPALLLLSCCRIAYEDFMRREVYILTLLVFSVLLLTQALVQQALFSLLTNVAISLLFIGIQALVVFIYFRFRKKELRFTDIIGGADIWMILVLALSFDWILYVFFITFSTVLTLILSIVIRTVKKNADERIPLAGYFAVFYAGAVIVSFLLDRALWNVFIL
jgi:hypothetical protein